jgi:hypothetical protein
MLTIEVKRHSKGESYFEPWIEDFEDGSGRRFHFHYDDISDEGVRAFSDVFTQQVRRWRPRPPGSPAGVRIPVTMERWPVMPYGVPVAVVDRPDCIAYTAHADLISARGAASITRTQSERSPYWERVAFRRQATARAV